MGGPFAELALAAIEYPAALDQVSRYAATPLGAARVRSLRPSTELGWIRDELLMVSQYAARLSDEDDLNQRIPLSVARWHQHVNLCLPARGFTRRSLGEGGQERSADWTRFGPRGSITTEAQCEEAGGRWRAHLFGWMIHVYPFESDQTAMWRH